MADSHWNAEALRSQLETLWPGIGIEIVGETGSTNTDLVDRTRAASAFAPSLRVAELQSAGRGRQGRPWLSERGASLTFSLAVPLAAADWSGLSLAVGVALAEALDAPDPEHRIGLKWPNDLWLLDAPGRGRKLGGVLIETVSMGAQRIAIIGVGLNLRPISAGVEVATGYACLEELTVNVAAPAVLERVAGPLATALPLFERAGFAAFHERFAVRDLLFDQPVRTTHADALEGVAAGVTPQGALMIRTPAGIVASVSSGEVSVRVAPASAAAASPPPC
ncbi:MAG TPA: biotin--[acetyl-CoA-carboxylase] ligase [Caldimonas sp.]